VNPRLLKSDQDGIERNVSVSQPTIS